MASGNLTSESQGGVGAMARMLKRGEIPPFHFFRDKIGATS